MARDSWRKTRYVQVPDAAIVPRAHDLERSNMPKAFAAALWGLLVLGAGPAWARIDCTPHCDYTHDYGPYDFTYYGPYPHLIQAPGVFGYPRCGPNGNCAPYLVYRYSDFRSAYPRPRVIIRPRPRVTGPRQ